MPAGRKIPMIDDKSEKHGTPWLRLLIAAGLIAVTLLIASQVELFNILKGGSLKERAGKPDVTSAAKNLVYFFLIPAISPDTGTMYFLNWAGFSLIGKWPPLPFCTPLAL